MKGPAKADLTGKTSGLWTVIRYSRNNRKGDRSFHMWLCRCACGTEREVLAWNILQGKTKGCGCETKARTHGLTKSRIFKIWFGMVSRCKYPGAGHYSEYGGRGIKVCDRWQKFPLFFADMGHPPSRSHSIDRMEVNGDYEPGNCRWATRAEQQQNQRRTKLTPEKVLAIRAVATPLNKHRLAAQYGVTARMIDNVAKHKAWKNIGGRKREVFQIGRNR